MIDRIRQFVAILKGAPASQVPPLSAASTSRLYHDNATQKLMLSQDGGAYEPIATGAAGAVDIIQIQSFS